MDEEASFYEQVLARVIRFAEYDSYGRKPRNAARSIRKKYPHRSLAECEEAFLHVFAIYEAAATLITNHEAALWEVYNSSGGKVVLPEELSQRFAQAHPSLPDSVTKGMLSWIFYWRHLR